MRPLCGISLLQLLLLLLLTCQLVTPTPIFDGAGLQDRHRSAGFGESVRDWFRMMKDRIVGKWNEWFSDEVSTPNFSVQDILDIDKTLEKRIDGYPGFFTDLWEKYGPDCDTDEWDFKSWLPSFDWPNIDWPNIFGKPEKPPTTVTPWTESTTIRKETTLRPFSEDSTTVQTEQSPVLTTTTAGTTIAESTATLPVTQVTTTASTEPTVTSIEEIPTSNESPVTNGESTVSTTESIVTSTEPILRSVEPTTTSSTESIATTNESEPSATSSTEAILTSTESIVITSESTMTPMSEEVTTTESPATLLDLPLPVYNNKRVEDNETIERPTKRPKNRPSSAEVIMF